MERVEVLLNSGIALIDGFGLYFDVSDDTNVGGDEKDGC
jgi:hypothetical protein